MTETKPHWPTTLRSIATLAASELCASRAEPFEAQRRAFALMLEAAELPPNTAVIHGLADEMAALIHLRCAVAMQSDEGLADAWRALADYCGEVASRYEAACDEAAA